MMIKPSRISCDRSIQRHTPERSLLLPINEMAAVVCILASWGSSCAASMPKKIGSYCCWVKRSGSVHSVKQVGGATAHGRTSKAETTPPPHPTSHIPPSTSSAKAVGGSCVARTGHVMSCSYH